MPGYDNLAINHGLLLDLPFMEGSGVITHDFAKPIHELTLHGTPAWTQLANGLMVLDFNHLTPDYLDCPAADTADLNFTSEYFNLAAWVCIDDLTDHREIIIRGLVGVDGWRFIVGMDGSISFEVSQGGASQLAWSSIGEVILNTWYLVSVSRNGTIATIYKNGIDVTEGCDTLINPLTSARDLNIGIYDDKISTPFAGMMSRPRIWGRCLTARDMMNWFQLTRHWFGL